MKGILWENLAVLLGAVFSFLYGARRYLQPRRPLYASMIIFGMGCLALGRLYQCVRILTGFLETGGFHVGVLGVMGAFSFFFSTNYGQFDSLVDDHGPRFRKYRLAAWAGPGVIAALYLPLALGPQETGNKIVSAAVAFVIAAACYFHVKHILIPDVDYGVVHCLRRFNQTALLFGVVCMVEMIALAYVSDVLFWISGMLLTVLAAAIVPVMDKGVRTWTT